MMIVTVAVPPIMTPMLPPVMALAMLPVIPAITGCLRSQGMGEKGRHARERGKRGPGR